MITLGQADSMTPWMPLVVQGGALALLTLVLGYIYPKAAKELREERIAQEAAAREERERRDKRLDDMVALLARVVENQTKVLVEALKLAGKEDK